MTLRLAKALLVAAVAFYTSLVVLNNLTDYGSNYQFVHHVLVMDSTFSSNHGLWRAVHPLWIQTAFYDTIIAWEGITMVVTWAGAVQLLRATRDAGAFQRAKPLAVTGLTLSLLMWLVAFLSIGGEWFLMWQSHTWNGEETASRMFLVVGVVFLLLVQPESTRNE